MVTMFTSEYVLHCVLYFSFFCFTFFFPRHMFRRSAGFPSNYNSRIAVVPSDTTVVHGLCLGVLVHLEAPNLLVDSKHIKPHETHLIWIHLGHDVWVNGLGGGRSRRFSSAGIARSALIAWRRSCWWVNVGSPDRIVFLCLQLKAFLRHGLVKNGWSSSTLIRRKIMFRLNSLHHLSCSKPARKQQHTFLTGHWSPSYW